MDTFFKDKDAKVIVVDASGAARTLLAEVVRGLGFTDVSGVAGIKEAISMLEVEPVRWIVTPLMSDQPENNGMQLLKLFCSHPALAQLRVSFLIEDSEIEVLPDAFEKGLLSFHSKPFTKDSLTGEFSNFLKNFGACNWNSTLMAGTYLRKTMLEQNRFDELLTFEKKLLDMYPGHFDLMFNIVPPLAKLGRVDEALATLKQIKVIDKTQEEKIKIYLDNYLDGKSLEDVESEGFNFLGLRKVVVVDSDDAVINEVTKIFAEMGVENVIGCSDGDAGIEALKSNNDVDLIIQEWRIPKLTGPLFLQKTQEEEVQSGPVILLSSLIEDQDVSFVKEMGVANIIKKPLKKDEFARSVIWTIQQDRLPTEQSTMERKMRQFLRDKKTKEAQEIKDRYVSDTTIKIGSKEVIEAEFAYVAKDYEKARDFGIEAIKHAGDSIFILNLLGKTMMNLREFDVALRCFEKAQSLAPLNIERLCQIAEVKSEMGDNEGAQETMDDASQLDPDSERVKETSAKVALNAGNTSKAKQIMSQLKAMENVVAYMNNQAVAMARCEMVQDGISQYRKTIESIPDTRPDITAIVNYNLALAYIRASDMKGAVEPLTNGTLVDSSVKEKSAVLLKKLKKSIEIGKPIILQKTALAIPNKNQVKDENGEIRETLDASKATVLTLVQATAGEMACHMVFHPTKVGGKAQKLMSSKVRFTPREAILKAASGGADKILAASA